MRDGAIWKTAIVREVWLNVGKYSAAQRTQIAKALGGDQLVSTLEDRITKDVDMVESEKIKLS